MFGPSASPWRSSLLSSYAALVAGSSPQKSTFPSQRFANIFSVFIIPRVWSVVVLTVLTTCQHYGPVGCEYFHVACLKKNEVLIQADLPVLGFHSQHSPPALPQGIFIYMIRLTYCDIYHSHLSRSFSHQWHLSRYGPPYRGSISARGTSTGISLSMDTKVEPVSQLHLLFTGS